MKKKIALAALAIMAMTSVSFVKAATNDEKDNTRSFNNRNEEKNERTTGKTTIRRTISGTIQSIGSDSFVIRMGNRNITVTTSGAQFMNANRTGSNFSDLRVGDKVNVTGSTTRTNGGLITTFSASAIRNLSR